MLASALPGDGKTFTSINLALSMAREHDVSVLLVDADVPKPHISRIFGVDKEPGLSGDAHGRFRGRGVVDIVHGRAWTVDLALQVSRMRVRLSC